MAVEVFKNIPTGTVTAGGTTAPAAGTVETWTVTGTALYPWPVASASATPPTQYHVCDPAATSEQILVTVAPGGTGAGQTWTVTRGAEGTTPVAHAGGFTIYQVVTAGFMTSVAVTIPPSGDTTGATDVANINAALAGGIPVQLMEAPLSAPYWINTPITPISQSRLWGAQWWGASNQDSYGAGIGGVGGSVIKLTSTFTGNAGINMVNATGTQYYGVDIAGITIDGSAVTGGTVYGLYADGAWGACFLRGVCIYRPPADCFRTTGNGVSGFNPLDWLVSECKFSGSLNGTGVNISNMTDSWFHDCESSENALDGWYFGWSDNTRLTACKGENNGNAGFHLGGLSNVLRKLMLTGCNSQFNSWDGFLFDAGYDNKNGTYILTGCASNQDNQAASTYAGFRSSGSAARIMGTGCLAFGAAYGAYQGSSATGTMSFTGSYFTGTTAATGDDGTNTNWLVNQIPAGARTLGTGIASSVVALTDAATITVNAALGNVFTVQLGGNRTIAAPSNPVDGQQIRFRITQDGTGSRTLTWNAAYDFGSGSAPSLSTGAFKTDIVAFEYIATTINGSPLNKWAYLGAAIPQGF